MNKAREAKRLLEEEIAERKTPAPSYETKGPAHMPYETKDMGDGVRTVWMGDHVPTPDEIEFERLYGPESAAELRRLKRQQNR